MQGPRRAPSRVLSLPTTGGARWRVVRVGAVLVAATLLLTGCGTARFALRSGRPAVAPVPGEPMVVTFGDSVPAGSNCDCDPFPDLYARAQHALSENLAEPGYTSANVRDQIAGARPSLVEADEVVLMIGANDLAEAFDDDTSFTAAADTVQQNVTAIIAAIEAIHPTTVVVVGYWNVVEDGRVAADDYGPTGVKAAATATDQANTALSRAAREAGATYVPTDVAFHGADGSRDPTDLLAADGDHPNAAGHAAIAALLPPVPVTGGASPSP